MLSPEGSLVAASAYTGLHCPSSIWEVSCLHFPPLPYLYWSYGEQAALSSFMFDLGTHLCDMFLYLLDYKCTFHAYVLITMPGRQCWGEGVTQVIYRWRMGKGTRE